MCVGAAAREMRKHTDALLTRLHRTPPPEPPILRILRHVCVAVYVCVCVRVHNAAFTKFDNPLPAMRGGECPTCLCVCVCTALNHHQRITQRRTDTPIRPSATDTLIRLGGWFTASESAIPNGRAKQPLNQKPSAHDASSLLCIYIYMLQCCV